ncbi:hypothetical protein MASR2M47_01670 [Draconibacterium sp.]
MLKNFVFLVLCFLALENSAQFVEVQYDYNNVGDCIFGASNNAKTPVYLNIIFTSIENTSLPEPWPYVKKLDPGFTGLFTLLRERDANAPQFIFEIKTFKSNPVADVNLDFPYLVPFAPGTIAKPVDVKNISGFWGADEPKSWQATGFATTAGQAVYAARQGQVVEIIGEARGGDSKAWYNTWTNCITLLQADGTLISYKNVIDKEKKLQLNQIVQAGQVLGEVAPNSTEVVLMIYHNTLNSPDLQFIIPLFVTAPGKTEILNSALDIEVVHPNEVRGLEMSKKELKNLLKSK